MKWALSSMSDSRKFMCFWKTPFSHSMPLGLSKWMPSEDASSGRERSIISATSNNLTGSTLLYWICLIISLMLRSFSFISLACRSVFKLYGTVQEVNIVGSRKILSSSRMQLIFSCSLFTFLDSPLDTSLVPIIKVTVYIFTSSNLSRCQHLRGCSSRKIQDSNLPM